MFVSPQLLLQYLMQGFETCYTVQTCIGHGHEGNVTLIQVIIAELRPLLLTQHTCLPFTIALVLVFIGQIRY